MNDFRMNDEVDEQRDEVRWTGGQRRSKPGVGLAGLARLCLFCALPDSIQIQGQDDGGRGTGQDQRGWVESISHGRGRV